MHPEDIQSDLCFDQIPVHEWIHRIIILHEVCCSVLQCVAVCCSVLQCVAVRFIILHGSRSCSWVTVQWELLRGPAAGQQQRVIEWSDYDSKFCEQVSAHMRLWHNTLWCLQKENANYVQWYVGFDWKTLHSAIKIGGHVTHCNALQYTKHKMQNCNTRCNTNCNTHCTTHWNTLEHTLSNCFKL